MCANLVANYKIRLTSVIANKGFATKSCFVKGSNTYHSLKCKSIYNFFKCIFLDFVVVVILSLTVQINLPLKL